VAYNALALSTLLYIAQLETPPAGVIEAETRSIRTMLGGPGNWYQRRDAFYLKEYFGQSKSYGSVELISQAAKLRVMHSHNCTRLRGRVLNAASISDMHTELQYALLDPIDSRRIHLWRKWYDQSHVTIIHRNETNIRRLGLSINMCLDTLARGEPRPWTDKVRAKQKRGIQKFVTDFLKESEKVNAEERIRDRVQRWMDVHAAGPSARSVRMLIAGPPRWVAARITRRLQRLPKLVPPRVCSAALRTIFNGWCTDRRFQGKGPQHSCVLGCSPDAADSIEHYCRCPITKDLFSKKLRIELHPAKALSYFAIATKEQEEDEILALSMLGVYAVYMCTNHYRYNPTHINSQHALQFLGQCLIQGCQGQKWLTRIFDKRWESPVTCIE
jgi:hypothetical protein